METEIGWDVIGGNGDWKKSDVMRDVVGGDWVMV